MFISQLSEHLIVKFPELLFRLMKFSNVPLIFFLDLLFLNLQPLNLFFEINKTIQLSFATALGGHLVFTTSSNVSDEDMLSMVEFARADGFVKCFHGQVDDVHAH